MSTNPEIFKAYDIRGVYNKDLDKETAYSLGRAYAEMRKEELGSKKEINIVIARDMRSSSKELKKFLIKGLQEGGINVIDVDLASTPTFYFAVAKYKYDGGIIITASHNPAEYNGFKLVREKASPIGRGTGMEKLKERVMTEKFAKAKDKGDLIIKKDALQDEIKHALKFVNIKKIKPLKIVADAANGMGALYLEELFKYLPGELIKMNFKLDGTFPAHEADPLKPENVKDLKKKVKKTKADLGIATDGDGDRIFFVDNKGKIIEPGILRAILSKIFLAEKPGSKIAYDIRPGKITRDIILENGGTPIITPVGHSLIKNIALKEKAYFAGESSGHFFLNLEMGCFEMPIIMVLKLLKEISQNNLPVSEYIKPYKKYFHSGEINFIIEDKNNLFTTLEKNFSNGEIDKLDGITITYPNFWFNIRASNTEPKVRLNLEAIDKKIMKQKTKEVIKIIKKFG